MRLRCLSVLALSLGCGVSLSAHALPEDRQQPINLEASSAEYDQKSGTSTYLGNVVVTQGTMRLTADVGKVFLNDKGEVQRMEATGKPATFRYRPSADKPEIDGVGQKIEYDTVAGRVIVSGGAKFVQGQDIFSGDRVEYDVVQDKVKATSAEGKRVRFVIQPKPDAPKADDKPKAKPAEKPKAGS